MFCIKFNGQGDLLSVRYWKYIIIEGGIMFQKG